MVSERKFKSDTKTHSIFFQLLTTSKDQTGEYIQTGKSLKVYNSFLQLKFLKFLQGVLRVY